MPEHQDFVALRDMLEADARQPAFAVIRARRRRRNHGQAAAASAAVGVLLLAIGTALALGVDRSSSPPIASTPPEPTSTDSAGDPGHQYYRSNIESMVRGPSGALYALANSCRPVDVRCDPSKGRHQVLVSGDMAASWTVIGAAPIGGRLLAASDVNLWIVESRYVFDARGTDGVGPTSVPDVVTVAGSTDGGRTWRTWLLDDVRTGSIGDHSSDAAGGTIWIAHGRRVYTASGVERPSLTATLPDLGNIYRIIAIGPDHAVVQGAASHPSPTVWFQTTDRGSHWTRMDDPCADTPQPGDFSSSMTVARDGTWWATCVAPSTWPSGMPGGPPHEVVISTDGGRTWQRRGALTGPAGGQAPSLYPISVTAAWSIDSGGDVMRTLEGTAWSTADDLGPGVFATSFVAMDAQMAVYVRESVNSTDPMFAVTRDGGRSWITHRLPAPPT